MILVEVFQKGSIRTLADQAPLMSFRADHVPRVGEILAMGHTQQFVRIQEVIWIPVTIPNGFKGYQCVNLLVSYI